MSRHIKPYCIFHEFNIRLSTKLIDTPTDNLGKWMEDGMKIVVIEATQVRALCEEKAIALDFVGDAHAEDLREIAYDADALETFNGESGDEVVAIEIVEGVVVAGRRYRVKPVQGE